jgi:hypothetical protein
MLFSRSLSHALAVGIAKYGIRAIMYKAWGDLCWLVHCDHRSLGPMKDAAYFRLHRMGRGPNYA